MALTPLFKPAPFTPAFRSIWHSVLLSLIGLNVLMFLAVAVSRWPDWDAGFGGRSERNLMSWFTSLQFVVAAFTVALIWLLEPLAEMKTPTRGWRRSALWLVFIAGLLVLGLDEYGGIHESIESNFSQTVLDNDGRPAEFVLQACALLGAVPAVLLIRRFYQEDGISLICFLAAGVISVAAVTFDELSALHLTHPGPFRRILEDTLELFGGGVFILTFIRYLLWVIQRMMQEPTGSAFQPIMASKVL